MKPGRILTTIVAACAAGALSSAYAADENRPGGPKDTGKTKDQGSANGASSDKKQSAAATAGTPVIVLVPGRDGRIPIFRAFEVAK